MEKVVIKTSRVDDCYSGACEILPGWVVACTGSFEDFQKEVKDSIRFYVDCARKDKEEYPAIFDNDFELVYKFDVQSLLLYYQGIFSFSALQAITGINQKQLAHYAAGRSKPRAQQAEKIANGLHKLAKDLMTVTV